MYSCESMFVYVQVYSCIRLQLYSLRSTGIGSTIPVPVLVLVPVDQQPPTGIGTKELLVSATATAVPY